MKKYESKPLVIEAMQLSQNNLDKVVKWCTNSLWMICPYGDWIIQGAEGEFYICKDSVFKNTYVEVA